MSRIITSAAGKIIPLGHRGEYGCTDIQFDITGYAETNIVVLHQRCGDIAPYAVGSIQVDQTNSLLTWTPDAIDTALAGNGSLVIQYYEDDSLVKTDNYITHVTDSLGAAPARPPAPYESWVDRIAAETVQAVNAKTAAETAQTASETASALAAKAQSAAEEAKQSIEDSALQIADNTSHIYELKEFLDTKQAQIIAGDNISIGSDGRTISAADCLVSSVNSKVGHVVLTAHDVGAATAAQGAKADTALQTVPDTYRTAAEQDVIDAGKQDTLIDLAGIRRGATLGASALQSVPDTYRTAAAQDVIDAGKQDTLIDLEGIRRGATLGASALQSVPSTYRTAAEQDAIHDSTKQDTLTASDKQAIADLHSDKVTSVNGKTGAVTISIPTVSNDFTDTYKSEVDTLWSDYQTAGEVIGS